MSTKALNNKLKILLTGGSGFLGGYFLSALSDHHITTIGRRVLATTDRHIESDLGSDTLSFNNAEFDLVIHAAGLAHVTTDNILEHKQFFETVNVSGTKLLLTALEKLNNLPGAFVYISSVSVYGREGGEDIKEDEPLLAKDPYGLSKRMAEDIIRDWCEKHSIKLAILRLPLVAGKNPPGNLGAMVHAIKKGYFFIIGNGDARRSIVSAEDVASVLIRVSTIGGIYNLTGNYNPTYREMTEIISQHLNKRVKSMPYRTAFLLSSIGTGIEGITGRKMPLNKNQFRKLTSTLTFSCEKANRSIGWMPQDIFSVLEKLID